MTDAITEVARPSPSHQTPDTHDIPTDEDDDDAVEATELRPVGQPNHPTPAKTSGSADSSFRDPNTWRGQFHILWRRHIDITVNHENSRDHMANERTFLAYLRTSLALSFTAITIAQLFRLEAPLANQPPSYFGFFELGKPLAGVFTGASMVMALAGSIRFFRQQNAMARGKVHAGGWEVYTAMVIVALVIILLFAVVLGLDAYQIQIG